MSNNKETELDKQDSAEVKNYTRTPNMLIFGYHDTISPQEKWLYVCLKHMCGKRGTRHLSLRYISEQTGISVGALSKSKDKKGNINEGMIKHLHDAGLIHSEIKQRNGKGNPLYHITITDVWGLNQAFFTRPNSEQDEDEENEPVRISDVPVRNSDKLARNSDKPVQISDEPVRKPLQYQDYIQDYNQDDNTNTRRQERESTAPESDTPTVSPPLVGDSRAALSPGDEVFTLLGGEEQIRGVIAQASLDSEGQVTEELIQRTIDALKHAVIVHRARPGLSEHPDDQLPSDTQSQQGDDDAHILPGSVDRAGTLPSAALGDLPPSGQDRPVATPTTRPVLEATEEIAVSKKGRDDGQRIANTPTPTPAQAPPPTSEQAAPGQAKGKGKKQAEVKTETPKGPPAEPPSEMAWGTRKCLLWFDFWRGGILIGKWKLMQASTCAKGLAEQFSEQQVIETRTMMEADPYYIDKGGCDVCDVANNIHRYLKRKQQTKKPAQATNVAQSQPITNIRELVKQREALRAATAVQVGV